MPVPPLAAGSNTVSIKGPTSSGKVDGGLTAKEAARASFEAAIRVAQHEHEIVKIKRQINLLAPVYRLPPEILGAVFVYVARTIEDHYHPHRWIKVTHICHEWRQVALHTPRVWNYIILGQNLEFMREVFARSKESPLDIISLSSHHVDVFRLVFAHIHHVSSIHFGHITLHEPTPSPLSAPLLRRIKFVTDDSSVVDVLDQCHMPKLSHLEIHTYWPLFPWSHTIFKNSLTCLTLQASIRRITASWDEVLAVLAGIPSLQDIDLANVLPRSAPHNVLQTIHLPRLATLRIGDSCGNCTTFLQHVTHPVSTHLWICTASAAVEFPVFCDEIANKLRGSPILGFCIHESGLRNPRGVLASIEEIATEELADDPGDIHDAAIILRVHFSTLHSYPFQPLVRLVESLPLSSVRNLALDQETAFPTLWSAFSNAMPKVRELGISSTSPRHNQQSIANLLTVPATPAIASPEQILFPHLETLLLSGLKLEHSPEDRDDGLRKHYLEMLSSRKSTGRMIEELIFEYPVNFSSSDIDSVGAMVREVIWDESSVSHEPDSSPEELEIEGPDDDSDDEW